MGSTWGRQDPGVPRVGPMNFVIRGNFASVKNDIGSWWGLVDHKSVIIVHEDFGARGRWNEITYPCLRYLFSIAYCGVKTIEHSYDNNPFKIGGNIYISSIRWRTPLQRIMQILPIAPKEAHYIYITKVL